LNNQGSKKRKRNNRNQKWKRKGKIHVGSIRTPILEFLEEHGIVAHSSYLDMTHQD